MKYTIFKILFYTVQREDAQDKATIKSCNILEDGLEAP